MNVDSKLVQKAGLMQSLFNHVEIELNTDCNLKCPYCPVSKIDRGKHRMNWETFNIIIESIANIEWDDFWKFEFTGKIGLHMYGEPFKREDLLKHVKFVRRKLPKCKIIISTNGTLLTEKKILEMFENGVNELDISEHTGKFNKNILNFLEKYPNYSPRINYNFFPNENTKIFNRGGTISEKDYPPLKDMKFIKSSHCSFAASMLEINWKGDVILCCNDYKNEYRFGNVKDRHLLDIWFDVKYLKIKHNILKGDFEFNICKNCGYWVKK